MSPMWPDFPQNNDTEMSRQVPSTNRPLNSAPAIEKPLYFSHSSFPIIPLVAASQAITRVDKIHGARGGVEIYSEDVEKLWSHPMIYLSTLRQDILTFFCMIYDPTHDIAGPLDSSQPDNSLSLQQSHDHHEHLALACFA